MDRHASRAEQNIAIEQNLRERIGGGQGFPAEIAALFDADLVFQIQVMMGCFRGSVAPGRRRFHPQYSRADGARHVRCRGHSRKRQTRRDHWCAPDLDQGTRQDHCAAIRDHPDDHRRCRDVLPDAGGQFQRLEGGPRLDMSFGQQTGGSDDQPVQDYVERHRARRPVSFCQFHIGHEMLCACERPLRANSGRSNHQRPFVDPIVGVLAPPLRNRLQLPDLALVAGAVLRNRSPVCTEHLAAV